MCYLLIPISPNIENYMSIIPGYDMVQSYVKNLLKNPWVENSHNSQQII